VIEVKSYNLRRQEGRIDIGLIATCIGADLSVIVFGGEVPHIGCVTLSIPRPGLDDSERISATTSVLNVTGHKDGEVLSGLSQVLAAALNKKVVVTGGIHLEKISADEIESIRNMVDELTKELILRLNNFVKK
jgi:hypothetical protein